MEVRAKEMTHDVSIILGFKNWGLDRLQASLASVAGSLRGIKFEIIVSDYGSSNPEEVKAICDQSGAKFIHTPSNGWSRAKALNIGIEASTGSTVMLTDADMVFSPSALREVHMALRVNSDSVGVIQCRDLPSDLSVADVHDVVLEGDYSSLDRRSHIRPRWGMGGLFACTRTLIDSIGGLDERMHTYGGEDLDLASRTQRAGARILWLDQPEVRMFHIWHQPSRPQEKGADKELDRAVAANRNIVEKDPTVIRNTTLPSLLRIHPLVSVVMSTRDRADLLGESIASVLIQTIPNFELIVIDDGSSDHTRELVESFSDPRVIYKWQEPQGISVARNYGTSIARGDYIAVHDDDDIMIPRRLEFSLNAIRPGINASFGSWVNFDETTGELTLNVSKQEFSEKSIPGNGAAPGHATWLVRRDLLKMVPYDEQLTSAVDNNVASRLASLGVRWAHTGRVMYLRRKHERQVTESDFGNQQSTADSAQKWITAQWSEEDRHRKVAEYKSLSWPKVPEKEKIFQSVGAWLPDNLVTRLVAYEGDLQNLSERLDSFTRVRGAANYTNTDDASIKQYGLLQDVSWRDLALLKEANIPFQILEHGLRNLTEASYNSRLVTDILFKHLVDEIVETDPNSDLVLVVMIGDRKSLPSGGMWANLAVQDEGKFDLRIRNFDSPRPARQFARRIRNSLTTGCRVQLIFRQGGADKE